MDAPSCLENADLVTTRFGSWPSFHDAEVLRLELTRPDVARIELDVRTWLIGTATNDRGYFMPERVSIVRFQFDGVEDLEIASFNQQNVVFGILIEEHADGIHVELEPIYGIDARWRCQVARVTRVVAEDAD